jgi:hypothetical protein
MIVSGRLDKKCLNGMALHQNKVLDPLVVPAYLVRKFTENHFRKKQ